MVVAEANRRDRAMRKAVRTYLELALGVTDTSTKKVRKAVEAAVGKGGATADQVKALTSDLIAARSANREGISKLVRFEVDRALGVVGLATADEVSELTTRVRELERQLREAETRASAPEVDADVAAARRLASRQAVAERATASATLPDASPYPAKRTVRKAATSKTAASKTTGATASATPANSASTRTPKVTGAAGSSTPTAKKVAAKKVAAKKSTGGPQ
jgi:polyhydroxyalkanoate synthesis regulator phasin